MQSERSGLDTIYDRSPTARTGFKTMSNAASAATQRPFLRHRAKSTLAGRKGSA